MPIVDIESIVENDDDVNDIKEYYQNVVEDNSSANLLETSNLSTIDNTGTVDPDIFVAAGKKWSSIIKTKINIGLKLDSTPGGITSNDINNAKKGRRDKQPILTINFKEYCKIVVNSEYGTAGMQQACYDAVAMCVKNYAINCYKLKGDLGYDITNVHTGGMSYLPHKSTFLNSCKNAVDNTWNKVMLTTGYGLFKAFFKSDTSASSYCIKNGGQLNLSEINTLAKNKSILVTEYYIITTIMENIISTHQGVQLE